MVYHYGADAQRAAFSAAAMDLLRQSRIRQRLSQAEVARRTSGAVSKASLANYENGHRSVRIDVLWLICRALGENPAMVLSEAAGLSSFCAEPIDRPVLVDVALVLASEATELAPVRRWFAMRQRAGAAGTGRHATSACTVALDEAAITALAQLMGVTVPECRMTLRTVAATASSAA